ncbi:hypothetical protein EON64_13295, partial [archaeon]
MAMLQSVHDQEVIYESPDPILVDSQPDFSLAATVDDENALSLEPLNPHLAHQYFHEALHAEKSEDIYSLAGKHDKKAESVFQRLQRLKGELAELTSSLDEMASAHITGPSVWSVLQQESSKLLSKAKDLDNHSAFQSDGREDRLLSLAAGERTAELVGSIATVSSSSFSAAASFASLERRLGRLETLLGVHTVGRTEGLDAPSLLTSLSRLEKKVSSMDAAYLEGVRTKASLLRWELEAMA